MRLHGGGRKARNRRVREKKRRRPQTGEQENKGKKTGTMTCGDKTERERK